MPEPIGHRANRLISGIMNGGVTCSFHLSTVQIKRLFKLCNWKKGNAHFEKPEHLDAFLDDLERDIAAR